MRLFKGAFLFVFSPYILLPPSFRSTSGVDFQVPLPGCGHTHAGHAHPCHATACRARCRGMFQGRRGVAVARTRLQACGGNTARLCLRLKRSRESKSCGENVLFFDHEIPRNARAQRCSCRSGRHAGPVLPDAAQCRGRQRLGGEKGSPEERGRLSRGGARVARECENKGVSPSTPQKLGAIAIAIAWPPAIARGCRRRFRRHRCC